MGNALTLIYGKSCKPTTTEHSDSLEPRYTPTDFRVSALTEDLRNFEITSQVPEGLSQHVVSSREAQAEWYGKLRQAWLEAKPPPTTPEEVAKLVILSLSRHQKEDVEVLLEFYGLPHPSISEESSAGFAIVLAGFCCLLHCPLLGSNSATSVERDARVPKRLPRGVKYEMRTLPVREGMVPDGDGINVYVSTADPRESSNVPQEVLVAASLRSQARAERNYAWADKLQQDIVESGYRVIDLGNEEILARKYRIRLRGIDAPENSMPYGEEAKQELVNLVNGKCLTVLVYGEDRYNRIVADVYCDGIFVQEEMLNKGLAWHYAAYDQRTNFELWERRARAKRVGLWASPNPKKPWEWRKDRREGCSAQPFRG